jgi:hypothetical protein
MRSPSLEDRAVRLRGLRQARKQPLPEARASGGELERLTRNW